MDILNKVGEVVIPGLLIVFLALVILIFAVWVMGKLMGNVAGKKKGKDTPAPPKPDPAPAAATPKPLSTSDVAGETVAAISAAVAVVMEETAPGVAYAITGVTRAGSGRPVWGFAGMQQNTRPF